MDRVLFENICAEYKRNYAIIFKHIYPAKNATGFTERNLSVNFSKAYETAIAESNQTCITWYEFQFGNTNNRHYDAIIINLTAKEILVIEAKRFNDLPRKLYSVVNDICRINSFYAEISNENSCRIANINSYKIYGVVLADIWIGNTSNAAHKLIIRNQYANNTFIKENKYIKNYINKYVCEKDKFYLNHIDAAYNAQGFGDCVNLISNPVIYNYYFLLSMFWELTL